jgi:hypothetical protein
MNLCNYNWNLMSIEMLKMYKIDIRLGTIFKRDDSLLIQNSLFINENKWADSRGYLYIIKEEKTGNFTYIIDAFYITKPHRSLYKYNYKRLWMAIAFFLDIEQWQ